jgi:CHAT domain-containing protein/tetratricopeptide (TPR) repeat protein
VSARRGARAAAARLAIATVAPVAVVLAASCGGAERGPEPDSLAIFALVDSLRQEGRSSEALPHWRRLRDSLEAASDTAVWWRAQLGFADALGRTGQRDSAMTALELAARLARGDARRTGRVHVARSILLDRAGRFDSAFAEAERARDAARRSGDPLLEADAHNAMGRIHSLSGRYPEALAANRRELELKRAGGARPVALATAYNELGIDYRHLGRFDEAIAVYERSLAIADSIRNPESRARVLFNLANVHAQLGDLDSAIALLEASLPLVEQIGDPRGLPFVLGGLGDIHLRAGNRETARGYLARALESNRRAGLPYGEAVTLVGLGSLELADANEPAATTHLRAALAIADSLGYGRQRAGARAGLARAAAARGDGRAARRWADAAVLVADSLGDPEAQHEALEARASALEAAGDARAAAAWLDAIALLESWRGRLALGDLRMGVAEPRLASYEGAIRTLLARGRPAEAFDVAERARARLLLELMADRRGGVAGAADDLRQRLRIAFEARRETRREDRRAALDGEIARLVDSLAARDRLASGAAAVAPAPIDSVRAGLLHPGRALYAVFWGDRGVYGWWVTADTVRATRLGDADTLALEVEFLRGLLEAPASVADDQWIASARRVHDALVAPLLAPHAGEREPADGADAPEVLAIVDGPLAHLPLEALVPADGAAPWGAVRRVAYGPSASVLLALARSPARGEWERAILAVGDPALEGGRRGAGGGARGAALPPLPHAAAEARAIASLFRDRGADVLLGRRATVERWRAMRPARYRFLHFAAHARVSDRRGDRTELLLADAALGLEEVRRDSLAAELVTLSACETARGRRVRGEGIIGLPHAFLSAGARGVVVTLWAVTDESAARFMGDFYASMRAGAEPAEAMRGARRARIAAGGAEAHPSRWAPFVLVGAR